jgi:molecular chaperone HscA
VKPTYGLDDATVEKMLIEALDHGEEDLLQRRLAEGRVEAGRILLATKKSLESDADLLEGDERARIEIAMQNLERACTGDDPRAIQACIEGLDRVTKDFAGRRMNRAIARAIQGHRVDEVHKTVERARGVEAHLGEHGHG